MARGRKKLEIDKVVFQRIVNELEAKQEFVNPSALWVAVCETDWAKGLDPRPLTPAVAYMRAHQLNIVTKTKSGKRGGTMTEERIAKMREGRGTRRPRSEKMQFFASTFEAMRSSYPSQYLPLIAKAEKGSLRAAITLNCIECSGFNRAEARQCEITSCALYPHHPSASDDLPEQISGEDAVKEAIRKAQEGLIDSNLTIDPPEEAAA